MVSPRPDHVTLAAEPARNRMADSGITPPTRSFFRQPHVRAILTASLTLAILAVVVEGFARLDRYAGSIMRQHSRLPLRRLVMVHTPPWLSRPILDDLAEEAVQFACVKHPNYAAELRNPLNGRILRKIARHYMTHQSSGMNAWIKRIVLIRRVWLAHEQVIEVYADYRRPAGLVKMAGKYYLITTHGTRLPGAYLPADMSALHWLMQIHGIRGKIPLPGQKFTARGIKTGLKLISLLEPEPYARQITAINVKNMTDGDSGTGFPLVPLITLETRWHTAIWWGLPPGKEGFYEVPARRKLKLLREIFDKYGRVDAGRKYVDIRSDQVLVPRPPKPVAAHSNSHTAGAAN